MKKIMMMLMVTMMMVILVAAPGWAVIDIKPSDGGGGIDTNPGTPFGNTSGTTQPQQPVSSEIKIYVNGTQIKPDVPAFVDSASRTQAPFRAIGEALGCKVSWDAGTQKVTCEKDGFTVTMTIGKKNYVVNGQNKLMDTVPVIKDSRTFIPVRALGEALNSDVKWDGATNTVTVISE